MVKKIILIASAVFALGFVSCEDLSKTTASKAEVISTSATATDSKTETTTDSTTETETTTDSTTETETETTTDSTTETETTTDSITETEATTETSTETNNLDYDIVLDDFSIAKLFAVISDVDILSILFEIEIETGSITRDCNDSGSVTVIEDEMDEIVATTTIFTQCAENGQTVTGTMNVEVVSNETSGSVALAGNFFIKDITASPNITSVQYNDFVINSSNSETGEGEDYEFDYELNISTTMVIVSDEISGTVGLSTSSSQESDIFVLKGANGTEYVETHIDSESTCTLNGAVITCFE